MKAMQFYAGAMKAAMSYVVKHSSDHHIHSVNWIEVSFMGIKADYLDVQIETTTLEGYQGHRWEIRVYKYTDEKAFSIEEWSVKVVEL